MPSFCGPEDQSPSARDHAAGRRDSVNIDVYARGETVLSRVYRFGCLEPSLLQQIRFELISDEEQRRLADS